MTDDQDIIARYAEGDGRWVTIGASKQTDVASGREEGRGGARVFIGKGGRILKGPKSLTGKNVGELDKNLSKSEQAAVDKANGERLKREKNADKGKAKGDEFDPSAKWGQGEPITNAKQIAGWEVKDAMVPALESMGLAKPSIQFAGITRSFDVYEDGKRVGTFKARGLDLDGGPTVDADSNHPRADDIAKAIKAGITTGRFRDQPEGDETASAPSRSAPSEIGDVDHDKAVDIVKSRTPGLKARVWTGRKGDVWRVYLTDSGGGMNRRKPGDYGYVEIRKSDSGLQATHKAGSFGNKSHRAALAVSARKIQEAIDSGELRNYSDDQARLARYAEGEGRWITIGADESEDAGTGKTERRGGARVFVRGGRIVKGPPALTGKSLDKLDKNIPADKRDAQQRAQGKRLAQSQRKRGKLGKSTGARVVKAQSLSASARETAFGDWKPDELKSASEADRRTYHRREVKRAAMGGGKVSDAAIDSHPGLREELGPRFQKKPGAKKAQPAGEQAAGKSAGLPPKDRSVGNLTREELVTEALERSKNFSRRKLKSIREEAAKMARRSGKGQSPEAVRELADRAQLAILRREMGHVSKEAAANRAKAEAAKKAKKTVDPRTPDQIAMDSIMKTVESMSGIGKEKAPKGKASKLPWPTGAPAEDEPKKREAVKLPFGPPRKGQSILQKQREVGAAEKRAEEAEERRQEKPASVPAWKAAQDKKKREVDSIRDLWVQDQRMRTPDAKKAPMTADKAMAAIKALAERTKANRRKRGYSDAEVIARYADA